jgi:Domain of unknown function (DUF4406)
MKVYLAGPMRGYDEFNFPAFRAAARALRAKGYEVFNPAESDENSGFDTSGLSGTDTELEHAAFDLRSAIVTDLTWVGRHAEGVVTLDGWEKSSGANLEVGLARFLSLPVMSLREALEVADASSR